MGDSTLHQPIAPACGQAYQRRTLGRTGIRIRPLGFGGGPIGGSGNAWSYGSTCESESERAVQEALARGCEFFDTADVYGVGRSESVLGRALRGSRPEVVIATKIGYDLHGTNGMPRFEPGYLRKALEGCLERLRTDWIDVLQLHNPPLGAAGDDCVRSLLEKFREEGKVRWLGVSAASVADAVELVDLEWIDTLQVRFHLLEPEALWRVFPSARKRKVGIIAREPLANGFLTSKDYGQQGFPAGDFRGTWNQATRQRIVRSAGCLRTALPNGDSLTQSALRFALSGEGVSVVIVGCKTAAQVRENFGVLGSAYGDESEGEQ